VRSKGQHQAYYRVGVGRSGTALQAVLPVTEYRLGEEFVDYLIEFGGDFFKIFVCRL
jgi:hypothetical protein